MNNYVIKLLNKKTDKVLRVGEDVYIRSLDSGVIEVREDFECGNKIEYFKSFAKMFERYEEIKEPLIKDKKIRKAVRAWAEAIGLKKVYFQYHNDYLYMSFSDPDSDIVSSIFFDGDRFDVKKYSELLCGNMNYTIEELCGEKE